MSDPATLDAPVEPPAVGVVVGRPVPLRVGAAAPDHRPERTARLSMLVVVQAFAVVTTALIAARFRVQTGPSWWYPVGAHVAVVALVWAIVARLPTGVRSSSGLVQAMTVISALSVGWNAVLLSTM